MKGISDKDVKKVARALSDQGFDVFVTSRGHVSVARDGRRVTTFSGSAGDRKALLAAITCARRAGFVWPLGQGREKR